MAANVLPAGGFSSGTPRTFVVQGIPCWPEGHLTRVHRPCACRESTRQAWSLSSETRRPCGDRVSFVSWAGLFPIPYDTHFRTVGRRLHLPVTCLLLGHTMALQSSPISRWLLSADT